MIEETPVSAVPYKARLRLLPEYMGLYIDSWPNDWTFDKWLLLRHPEVIPGRKEWCCVQATHCFYCGKKFASGKGSEPKQRTIDHFQPKSENKGNRIDYYTYVIACWQCNQMKANRTPEQCLSSAIKRLYAGKDFWTLTDDRLRYLVGQLQMITNNVLHNTGPGVYYTRK
jgi:5-methylcytosine-specific restriction endonuclease McrA